MKKVITGYGNTANVVTMVDEFVEEVKTNIGAKIEEDDIPKRADTALFKLTIIVETIDKDKYLFLTETIL